MKMNALYLPAVLFALAGLASAAPVVEPVDWVNPLMGTASKPELSNGNTYPTIALPWGMNFWTPQTGKMGNGWTYTYDADKIRGFKQTHQPSPWMNDYGQFAIMPVVGQAGGKPKFTQDDRASWFSHKAEVAKPYYYSVYLADADVTTEITPTERAAQFRFTFPQTDEAYVVVDAYDKGSYIKVIPAERKIVGYSTRHARGPLPENFKNYFVLYFDKPFASIRLWNGDQLAGDVLELAADHAGALVGFKTVKGEKVGMKVASSFISEEQAELNLRRELANDSFDTTAQKGRAIWNKTLGRITSKAAARSKRAPSIPACIAPCSFRISSTRSTPTTRSSIGVPTTARSCQAICSPAPASGIPSARSTLSSI